MTLTGDDVVEGLIGDGPARHAPLMPAAVQPVGAHPALPCFAMGVRVC
jgi:hypothetical protein